MDNLILLILGLFISVLGITNIKGNISTIHSYNRRKVKEEDIPKYGKVVGTGTLIMGVSYNGPIVSDHSSKDYREHGKIQQESEKETTP